MTDQTNMDWARSLYQEAGHCFADCYCEYTMACAQEFTALAEEIRLGKL